MYTASFENVTITAAVQDIWELVAGATTGLLIHAYRLTIQPTITSGVAQDERWRLQRLARSTTGSGGVAVTPRPENPRMTVAALTTATRTVTTPGTAGNPWGSDRVSIIVPYERIFTPAQRQFVPAATRWCLALLAAPSGSFSASGEVDFEEL
jgi:hypothetical protein